MKKLKRNSIPLTSLLVAGCGSNEGGDVNNDTDLDLISGFPGEVVFQKNVHQIVNDQIAPGYWYEGEYTPPQLISYFPQGVIVFDEGYDNDLDVIVPLNKGYRSGVDTRENFLFFSNSNGDMVFDLGSTNELPLVSGSRRTEILHLNRADEDLIITAAHDTSIQGEIRLDIPWRMGDLTAIGFFDLRDHAVEIIGDTALPTSFVGRSTAVNAHAMAVGDINGDGMDDILVADYGGAFVLYQTLDGPFDFSPQPLVSSFTHTFDLPSTSEVESCLLLDLHLADLDSDGFDDLVAGWGNGGNRTTIFFNDQLGNYLFENSIVVEENVYGKDNDMHMKTFSEDFDMDGDLDLVILHSRYEPYYGGNYLQFILNNDGVQFVDATEIWFGSPFENSETFSDRLRWTDFWQIYDINNDGYLDILGHTPEWSDDERELLIYINNNGSSFTRHEVKFDGGRPIAWGDFDSDGRLDFISAQNEWVSSTLNIYNFDLYELNGEFV